MTRLARKMRDPMVALGAGQFGLALMQSLFMFYYVKVYLNVFKISDWWFGVAQALFLVWNAINDPLFGYLQDSSHSWLSSRRLVVRRLAPLIAASFVFAWLQAPYEQGLHLVLALFFYDAFFSAIGVAWSAMFAEVEGGSVGRASAMKHSQVAILLSVNIIPIAEKVSGSLEFFDRFQWLTIVVALLGWACLYHCSTMAASLPMQRREAGEASKSLLLNDENGTKEEPLSMRSVKQVLSRRDFLCIIAVNCVHNARSVMHMNFASISTELLVPQAIMAKGSLALAAFYSLCTLAPQILIILSERVVLRRGAHALVQDSFLLTIAGSVLLWAFAGSPWVVMLFMLIDSIAVHSTAPLFNIIISEFIEDDVVRNGRSKPLSSLVFGLNALFVKPAQSIAPLAVVYWLNAHGYEAYKQSKTSSDTLVEASRAVLFIPPLALAAIQYAIFRFYTLGDKNRHRAMTM